MEYPFFSVIIPVFNREQYIQRAIESVLIQTFEHFEVIIVNDGSLDNTKKIIMSYSDPRISCIDTPHCGVSHARNTGIGAAQSRYIAFLDSDDAWMKQKLAEDYRYIQTHPDSLIHQSDERWIRNGVFVNKKKIHQKKEGYIFQDSLKMCMISPSSVVIHAELFTEIGLFDERMKVCEDYELWLRITRKYTVGLIDAVTITKYGGHPDQLSHAVDAIDRYRIYAMCKLLGQDLSPEQVKQTKTELLKKCGIVETGARKRGNNSLAQGVAAIRDCLTEGSMPQDVLFLLKE